MTRFLLTTPSLDRDVDTMMTSYQYVLKVMVKLVTSVEHALSCSLSSNMIIDASRHALNHYIRPSLNSSKGM